MEAFFVHTPVLLKWGERNGRKENRGKSISKTGYFTYNKSGYYNLEIKFLTRMHPFASGLLTIGLRCVNQWFSCRKPMVFTSKTYTLFQEKRKLLRSKPQTAIRKAEIQSKPFSCNMAASLLITHSTALGWQFFK